MEGASYDKLTDSIEPFSDRLDEAARQADNQSLQIQEAVHEHFSSVDQEGTPMFNYAPFLVNMRASPQPAEALSSTQFIVPTEEGLSFFNADIALNSAERDSRSVWPSQWMLPEIDGRVDSLDNLTIFASEAAVTAAFGHDGEVPAESIPRAPFASQLSAPVSQSQSLEALLSSSKDKISAPKFGLVDLPGISTDVMPVLGTQSAGKISYSPKFVPACELRETLLILTNLRSGPLRTA